MAIQSRVDHDPKDHECAERCHETFFYDVPNAAVFVFVYFLVWYGINVDNESVQQGVSISKKYFFELTLKQKQKSFKSISLNRH